MQIKLAKTAGFCFGVNRAVDMVEKLVDSGEKVCTLGPIIHNSQLVEQLEKRGVRIIESPDQSHKGQTVIIRAHGEIKETYDKAKEKNIDF